MNNLINTFLKEKSFENYSDAAVLDLLFSTAGVRGDTLSIIDTLYSTFGSYKGILEARPEQLLRLPGITKKVATLVSMITPLAKFWERTNMDNTQRITNAHDAEAFCKSLMLGSRTEKFYVVCLNARCAINGYRQVSEGSISEVCCYPRIVMEAALNYNAHSVILSHCHPGGTCAPSTEDIASTIQLQKMLKTVDILVLDHIIIAGPTAYSMARNGDLEFRCR